MNKFAQDYELAQRAARGDETAFEIILAANIDRIRSLCLRIMRCAEEAEEMTQATRIQVWRKLGSYKGDSTLSTWIFSITRNICFMRLRSAKKGKNFHAKHYEDLNDYRDALGRSDRPDEMLDLQRAVEQLPKGYRNCFLLHFQQGFEHEEIAQILGCAPGTSKSQSHKGRLMLQKLLNKKANPRLLPKKENVYA